MRVLGIDPGYDRMGVAIVDQQNGQETVLFSTCLSTDSKADFPDRLLSLGQDLEKIIKQWQPDTMSTEKLFITTNQKTATNVAEVRGMVGYLARRAGLAVAEYTPLQIKMVITGYGKATKDQVTQMIGKLVTLDKKIRLDDEYDAIGIALTHLACVKYNSIK